MALPKREFALVLFCAMNFFQGYRCGKGPERSCGLNSPTFRPLQVDIDVN